MNKKVNEKSFNIAIFDKNSIYWVSDMDANAYFIYSCIRLMEQRLMNGKVISLGNILNGLGISVQDNQMLAGWDSDNCDRTASICEIFMDNKNNRIVLNFVNCDETMLLKHYEKDRMASIKKYCDYDALVLQDVYNDIWKIAAISSDHGNTLMDIIDPDKYAEIMKKQGK